MGPNSLQLKDYAIFVCKCQIFPFLSTNLHWSLLAPESVLKVSCPKIVFQYTHTSIRLCPSLNKLFKSNSSWACLLKRGYGLSFLLLCSSVYSLHLSINFLKAGSNVGGKGDFFLSQRVVDRPWACFCMSTLRSVVWDRNNMQSDLYIRPVPEFLMSFSNEAETELDI